MDGTLFEQTVVCALIAEREGRCRGDLWPRVASLSCKLFDRRFFDAKEF